ncbi:MAG: acetate--CoA ligase, partial [Candidatus Heimdallarchaeota archaeon]
AMLACAKIGAIHSVVFSGFSALALANRICDCKSKAVITCDSFYRRGNTIPLKSQTDEAMEAVKECDWGGSPEHVIVFRRTGEAVPWTDGRDLWWHDLTAPQSAECTTEIMDAQDLLFLLYTSGTTGKPKGIQHAHGGYAVGTASTLKWIFDLKDNDIWWCAADIGWITGHSYIVYGPLLLGVTSIMYEGAPTSPDPGRWWRIIERYGVTVFYTSPTAVRLFMRYGEDVLQGVDLSSLRLLGSVGEPINPEAWIWYYKHIGQEKCQIMDTWWQTETGMQLITPLPITPLKPGSATFPFPGVAADVFDEVGNSIQGAGGALILSNPWPAMLRGIWGDPDRYMATYWMRYDGYYLTGDVARRDEDGYLWIQGRQDDILSVAGHRIGNSEVESALVSHPVVAESAVIGKPHTLKGESITAYVVLREGVEISDELRNALKEHVSKEIGKIARPDEVRFVQDVPKTRSGKIMRRVIRASALGQPVGDLSTLSNPEAVEEIAAAK